MYGIKSAYQCYIFTHAALKSKHKKNISENIVFGTKLPTAFLPCLIFETYWWFLGIKKERCTYWSSLLVLHFAFTELCCFCGHTFHLMSCVCHMEAYLKQVWATRWQVGYHSSSVWKSLMMAVQAFPVCAWLFSSCQKDLDFGIRSTYLLFTVELQPIKGGPLQPMTVGSNSGLPHNQRIKG